MGLAAGLTTFLTGVLPESLAFAAPELAGGLLGAGGGALLSGITGGNPLTGALTGGLTGGFVPLGGALGPSLGISAGLGDVLGGVAGGLLGSGITGGNLLTGGLEGLAGGALGALGGVGSGSATGAGTGTTTTLAPAASAGGQALSDFSSATDPFAGGAESAPASFLNASSPDQLGSLINSTPANFANLPSTNALLAAPSQGSVSPAQLSQFLKTGGISPNSAANGGLTFGPATPGGSGGILGNLTSLMSAHPTLTSLAGLGGSQLLSPLLQKISGANKLTPAEQQLVNQDQAGVSAANSLIGSLQSGTLPPGAQQLVDQNLNQQISAIRSRYASLGMSGSSAEQQDIQNAQNNALAEQFQIANNATATGLQALGLNEGVYGTILQAQLQSQQGLSNSISQFFNSLALGSALRGATA